MNLGVFFKRNRLPLLFSILGACGLLLYTCAFQVTFFETAVIFRFGRIARMLDNQGIHFKLPYPIESVQKVNKYKTRRLEIGFRSDPSTKTFTDKDAEPRLWELMHTQIKKVFTESLIITGDENIVDVNTVIHYRINDVRQYLTQFTDPETCLKTVLETIIRQSYGEESLDAVLVSKKGELQNKIKAKSQKIIEKYKLGIEITEVRFAEVHPPVEVVFAFRDVASAKEAKNTYVHQAKTYEAELVPGAKGQKARNISEAESYHVDKDLRSLGDATRKKMLSEVYRKNGRYLKIKKYYDSSAQTYSKSKLFLLPGDLIKDIEVISYRKDPPPARLQGIPRDMGD